jgi:hypothetical protein
VVDAAANLVAASTTDARDSAVKTPGFFEEFSTKIAIKRLQIEVANGWGALAY